MFSKVWICIKIHSLVTIWLSTSLKIILLANHIVEICTRFYIFYLSNLSTKDSELIVIQIVFDILLY